MHRLFAALRRKWTDLNRGTGPAVPCRVGCACGQTLQGVRAARHQVLRCPACGESVFVLPRSPLPPTGDEDDSPPGTQPPRPPWLLPLAAGGLALVVVVAGLFLFFSRLGSPADQEDERHARERQTAEEVKEA